VHSGWNKCSASDAAIDNMQTYMCTCIYMDACVTPHASGVNDIILFRVQVNFITLDNGPI